MEGKNKQLQNLKDATQDVEELELSEDSFPFQLGYYYLSYLPRMSRVVNNFQEDTPGPGTALARRGRHDVFVSSLVRNGQ